MKKIYFHTGNHSECILAEKDISQNSYGYFWVKDILGREHHLPIANTYAFVEEWDGKTEGIERRFWDAINELKGVQTGTLTTQKK